MKCLEIMETKVVYGVLNTDNTNLIIDKAKSKADGIYSFRGILFKVNNGGVTHYATTGKVYAAVGHFVTQVGSYSTTQEAKLILKSIK